MTIDVETPKPRKILPFGPKAARFARRPPKYDAKINILEGAVRSAKTWACIPKIVQLCRYPVAGQKIIFGVTKQTIYNNVLNDLFEIFGNKKYNYNRQTGELDLMGSKWSVVGAKDEGSEKYIRGATIGAAVGDELTLLPPSFLKMLLNRMSPSGARMYGTTNPDVPTHYVKTDLLDNVQLRESGELWSEHFVLSDNPNLDPSYIAMLNRLYPPGSFYHMRFVKGLWVMAQGGIYKDCWSDELLYDDVPWTMADGRPGMVRPENLYAPPTYAGRYCPMDCGVNHVQVYADVIDDLHGDIWFDREYWWDSNSKEHGHRQKTDGQYREDLQKFMRGEAIEFACEEGHSLSDAQVIIPPECASFKAELSLAGIWYTEADNEVLDGIKHTASLMALRKLHFHRRRMKNTINQILSYVWDDKARLRGVEQPLKTLDDGPDMVRYFCRTKVSPWRLAA